MKKDNVLFTTDGACSLPEAWALMSKSLLESGAGQSQVDTMKIAYYMGAAQVFVRIHEAFDSDDTAMWHELRNDIDRVLTVGRAGHA